MKEMMYYVFTGNEMTWVTMDEIIANNWYRQESTSCIKCKVNITSHARKTPVFKITEPAKEAMAFSLFQSKLNIIGYPKKKNGAWLDIWDLYQYWLDYSKRDSLLKHVGQRPR